MRKVETKIAINASPQKIIKAFTDSKMLGDWWGVERNLIQLKPGGLYSLAWKITENGFGFVSTGIIKEYQFDSKLVIENFAYFNPERSILGPMSLTIKAMRKGELTELYICQDGYQDGQDWNWYYEAVVEAWPKVIQVIKDYIEKLAD